MLAAFAVMFYENVQVFEIVSFYWVFFIVRVLALWLPGCATTPAQVFLGSHQINVVWGLGM